MFIHAYLVQRKADRDDISAEVCWPCETYQCYVIGGVPRILLITFVHDYFFHINLLKKRCR